MKFGIGKSVKKSSNGLPSMILNIFSPCSLSTYNPEVLKFNLRLGILNSLYECHFLFGIDGENFPIFLRK